MRKIMLISALLSISHIALAEEVPLFQPFIPKGYNLFEHECKADFNKDGKTDCFLLVDSVKETIHPVSQGPEVIEPLLKKYRSGIIILLATNNGYQKVAENLTMFETNNMIVYRYGPELLVESKGNKLIVNYLNGRWGAWSYTFDYRDVNNKKDFYLIGYDYNASRDGYEYGTDSVNFLTNKYRNQENTNQNEEQKPNFKTTWYDLPKQPLVKLSDIQDIDNFHEKLYDQLDKIKNPNDSTS